MRYKRLIFILDMSVEEFRATVLMTEGPKKGQKHTSTIGATVASPDAPDTFDWY